MSPANSQPLQYSQDPPETVSRFTNSFGDLQSGQTVATGSDDDADGKGQPYLVKAA